MQEFNNLVQSSNNILVVSHIRPDWDALSSALSTYTYLLKTQPNKKIDVAFSSFPAKQFEELKYYNKILWVDDITQIIENYDLVIFVDGNDVSRFSDTLEFTAIKAKTICIDHHPDNGRNYNFKVIETSEGSCAGLIYRLLFRDNKNLLDKDLTETILLGILSDTGSFSFLTKDKLDSLDYTKELLEIGELEFQLVHEKLTRMSLEDLELIKILLNNLKNQNGYSYSYFPVELSLKYDINKLKEAKDKFVFIFLRHVKGFPWGFVVMPQSDKRFQISFRSSPGSPDVSEIAQKFGGGGHRNASGADITYSESKTSEQVCEEIINKMNN